MSISEYKNRTPNLALAKKLQIANGMITAAVLILVILMQRIQIPLPEGINFRFLPPIYSSLNAAAAVLLVAALVMIKRGNPVAHRNFINAAMICSIVFLLGYVVYHVTEPATKFGGSGIWRGIYFGLLISHIILAAISLPFILTTWIYSFTNQFEKHRRFARWVFPIWLYVAVSGPVCYLMLRPYYSA